MIHTIRGLIAAVALAGIIAAGVLGPGASASGSSPAVLISKRTVIPKIQRTVRFTGYATYTFRAPRGRRIVSVSARITGGEGRAVKIGGRTISHNRMRYTVRLVFPGEQGNPGKLVVLLGTIA